MSELKAHRILGMNEECACVENDYYLKSEADKVFKRLKARLARKGISNQQLELDKNSNWRMYCSEVAKNRHHEYKRCLGMAKTCKYRWMNLEKMIDTKYRTKKMRLCERWQRIWLKLAEKFKPNKEVK